MKKVVKFQKSVSPDSVVHRRGNVNELKKIVEEISQFVREELPFEASQELYEDLKIGVKGIVTVGGVPASRLPVPGRKHPQLNTDDL